MGELKRLLNEIEHKEHWNRKELKERIMKKLENEERVRPKVEDVQVYDFFSTHIATMPHPCIIFRMEGECVWGIVMSTNAEGCHNISKVEGSRYMSESYYTNTIICCTKEQAFKNWLGIFDNPQDVKRVVKLLKNYYQNILK